MSSSYSTQNTMAPPPPPKPNRPLGNGNVLNGSNGSLSSSTEYQNGNGRSHCYTPPQIHREQVVMTPKGKTTNSTVILIERKLVEEITDRVHVAGGDHTGIIINKDTVKGRSSCIPAQLSLEFRVFLVSANSGKHSQESRTLKFWFRNWLKNEEKQAHVAQDFFRELVSPKEFPRDYVGFIKKIMKLLQRGYDEIQSLEIELKILEETSAPPSRPPRDGYIIYCYGDCNRKYEEAILAQKKSGDRDVLMEAIWLEVYKKEYKRKEKKLTTPKNRPAWRY